mmetsp:Transcript_40367/g.130692  ORF Transcript_40367/g.130692 Transcript_40367/m.130692 type:complete len:300 (+) Transcript_40367:291-1190(+)
MGGSSPFPFCGSGPRSSHAAWLASSWRTATRGTSSAGGGCSPFIRGRAASARPSSPATTAAGFAATGSHVDTDALAPPKPPPPAAAVPAAECSMYEPLRRHCSISVTHSGACERSALSPTTTTRHEARERAVLKRLVLPTKPMSKCSSCTSPVSDVRVVERKSASHSRPWNSSVEPTLTRPRLRERSVWRSRCVCLMYGERTPTRSGARATWFASAQRTRSHTRSTRSVSSCVLKSEGESCSRSSAPPRTEQKRTGKARSVPRFGQPASTSTLSRCALATRVPSYEIWERSETRVGCDR